LTALARCWLVTDLSVPALLVTLALHARINVELAVDPPTSILNAESARRRPQRVRIFFLS